MHNHLGWQKIQFAQNEKYNLERLKNTCVWSLMRDHKGWFKNRNYRFLILKNTIYRMRIFALSTFQVSGIKVLTYFRSDFSIRFIIGLWKFLGAPEVHETCWLQHDYSNGTYKLLKLLSSSVLSYFCFIVAIFWSPWYPAQPWAVPCVWDMPPIKLLSCVIVVIFGPLVPWPVPRVILGQDRGRGVPSCAEAACKVPPRLLSILSFAKWYHYYHVHCRWELILFCTAFAAADTGSPVRSWLLL